MKTAMQELINWLEQNEIYYNKDLILKIRECREVEKEHLIDAFDYGYHCASNGTSAEITLDGKMYYNQTYNQNK